MKVYLDVWTQSFSLKLGSDLTRLIFSLEIDSVFGHFFLIAKLLSGSGSSLFRIWTCGGMPDWGNRVGGASVVLFGLTIG